MAAKPSLVVRQKYRRQTGVWWHNHKQMNQNLKPDEWNIIETSFKPANNLLAESCFSLGNGRMGLRGNFEEQYTGEMFRGSYIGGIYFLDSLVETTTKIGNKDVAKILNCPNWIGIDVLVDGEMLDLATCKVKDFRRVLNMKEGWLERSFSAKLVSGKEIKVKTRRFCSMTEGELGAIQYAVTPVNFEGIITFNPYVDADVTNKNARNGEKYWTEIEAGVKRRSAYILAATKGTQFQVCTGMKFAIIKGKSEVVFESTNIQEEKYVECSVGIKCRKNEEVVLYKYAAIVSSINYDKTKLKDRCKKILKSALKKGWQKLLDEHIAAWAALWEAADIIIEGDVAAQQGIRFNIFHLFQTYTGNDERLNIAPKGFTGEKHGGNTHWDTEAFCLPFYLAAPDPKIARNLLIYRYKHLPKAIENAQKMGFKNGAALYPVATMTGEECHNEWEIALEEIHRNGAIAYAIYDYIRYSGDKKYMVEYGLEVLVAIARFWSQRVNWSNDKNQFVLLGVTGPNQYENNVNNNWYTNYIAAWCLNYACEAVEYVSEQKPEKYAELNKSLKFDRKEETAKWKEIATQLYSPINEESGVFLQQDGYLDKEIKTVADLAPQDRPLNQNWTWDRILRSCFIKQSDVLQGLYLFEDQFDTETIQKNFDFYEPCTVHESSLSPCVHAVLAAKIGRVEKACELYLQTARLDLDNYNNDTEHGLHITGMAGTWMAFVKGFGGMRVEAEMLSFNPFLPSQWQGYSFKVQWRGHSLQVKVDKEGAQVLNLTGKKLTVKLNGEALEM